MNKHGQSMVYFIGKKYMTKVSTEILWNTLAKEGVQITCIQIKCGNTGNIEDLLKWSIIQYFMVLFIPKEYIKSNIDDF
jgi:hypothetical protein